ATTGAMRSRSWPSTTARWVGAVAAIECSAWASIERPARVCSTLGVSEAIRVPAPAASTSTAVSSWRVIEPPSLPGARTPRRSARLPAVLSVSRVSLWVPVHQSRGGPARSRADHRRRGELRRQDSNLNSQNQNLMCCRLHHDGPHDGSHQELY